MIDLTDEFLKPRPGTICYWPANLDHPVAGTWDITIPLEPFSADDEYEPATFRPGAGGPELVKTEIMLEFIKLPADELAALSQRTFTFPVNHQDGYIDGSIYLIAAHCPVDVTRIEFGQATPNQITATLCAFFNFDAAGGIDIRNRAAVLETDCPAVQAGPAVRPQNIVTPSPHVTSQVRREDGSPGQDPPKLQSKSEQLRRPAFGLTLQPPCSFPWTPATFRRNGQRLSVLRQVEPVTSSV